MVAHDTTQVPLGHLSTGYIAALFSGKHSKSPEGITNDIGRNIRAGIDGEKREHAIRLFRCLTFSRWSLRARELTEVLAIQLDPGELPKLNVG